MHVMLRCAGDKVRSVCLCLFVCLFVLVVPQQSLRVNTISTAHRNLFVRHRFLFSVDLQQTNILNQHFFPLYVMTIQFVIPFTVSKLCSVCIYEQECIPVGCIPSATVAVSWGLYLVPEGVPGPGGTCPGVYLVGAVYLPGGCTWSRGTCPGTPPPCE